MDKPKKKRKTPKLIRFLTGYSLGFISWLAGLHCLVPGQGGQVSLSGKKLGSHLLKVFMWTLEISLLINLLLVYRDWLLGATTLEIEMAFVVKAVVFLYVKVFWPRVFPKILPGLRLFFCPQCYQKQTFRFLPVSFQFGFFVTYLCGYCSCLVDGWGEQIFYPVNVSLAKITPCLMKTIPAVLLAAGLGFGVFRVIWGLV